MIIAKTDTHFLLSKTMIAFQLNKHHYVLQNQTKYSLLVVQIKPYEHGLENQHQVFISFIVLIQVIIKQ
jgi:hypothetical protein